MVSVPKLCTPSRSTCASIKWCTNLVSRSSSTTNSWQPSECVGSAKTCGGVWGVLRCVVVCGEC